MTKQREGIDKWGSYVEQNTTRGWRKIRRTVNGFEFAVANPETADYKNAILSTGMNLKLNMMSDRLEIEDYKNGGNIPISDIQESVLINRLNDYGLRNEGRMRRAMHEAALQERYHPIKSYLEAIEWDGKSRWDAFINCLDITSEAGEIFIRKFMLGSIAKIYQYAQNYMLVFISGQGVGKSRLARWLCPIDEMFFEGAINPDNKDSLIRLINYWLWEVAELDSTTRRSDRSALKHFITQQRVNVRVPYGRYDISKPAAASMIGTVNPDGKGFLNDPTDNRRFSLVEIKHIDWKYSEIDRGQLWGELFTAYKDGEQFELTQHESEIQAKLNLGHTEESPLEALLTEWYEVDASQGDWFSGSMDILEKLKTLGLEGRQYMLKMELANVMTKLKLEKTTKRINGRLRRGYQGIRIRSDVHELNL